MSTSTRFAVSGSIAVSIAFVMELTLVPLLLPDIQTHFDLSVSETALVFNSYGVAVAFGVILGGSLGDLLATKKVFGFGVLLFAMGSIVVAFSESFGAVVVGRILQGFGGGVFSPLVPILLVRALPSRPGKVLIVWGSTAGYAAAFAPLIFSRALIEYGWRSAFVLFALIAFIALIIVNKSYTEGEEDSRRVIPNYAELLKSGDLWLLFAYVFCTYGAITYFLFRLPLWMTENGHEIIKIGAVLTTIWLSFSIVGTLLRNRVDGPYVRSMIFLAPALIALAFALAYFFENPKLLFISAAFIGFGFACSNSTSTQMILKLAPSGMKAICASIDITFARLGGVIVVTFLADSEIHHSVLVIALMSLVALACAALCVRKDGDLT